MSGNFMSRLPTSCSVGLLLFILSPCCVIYGCREWQVSYDVSSEAVPADLAKLENGEEPPDNHARLGPHVACYFSGVYIYMTDREHPEDPEDDTNVTSFFYPIVSESDPNVKEIGRLLEEYGTLDDVPEDVPIPPIEDFRVLIKTDRFDDVQSLPPTAVERVESVQGLVINRIAHLDADTKKYIRESFPTVDFKDLLIIEEGREPSSMWFAQGVTFCATFAWLSGILFCIVGVVQAIVRAASPKSPATFEQETIDAQVIQQPTAGENEIHHNEPSRGDGRPPDAADPPPYRRPPPG